MSVLATFVEAPKVDSGEATDATVFASSLEEEPAVLVASETVAVIVLLVSFSGFLVGAASGIQSSGLSDVCSLEAPDGDSREVAVATVYVALFAMATATLASPVTARATFRTAFDSSEGTAMFAGADEAVGMSVCPGRVAFSDGFVGMLGTTSLLLVF